MPWRRFRFPTARPHASRPTPPASRSCCRKKGAAPKFNRVAYAAAHVVADPLADNDPWLDAAVDWDKTIAFRDYLWDLGLGVAEAMDTAQRGMGLDWNGAQELIRRALEAAQGPAGREDRLRRRHRSSRRQTRASPIDDIIRAYEEQIEAIEAMGGRLIVMASRALARAARRPGRLRAGLWPHPAPGEASR